MVGVEHDDLVTVAYARQATKNGFGRMVRIAADLSQREVAASIGVDVSTISRWESGERLPRGASAVRYGHLIEALASQQRSKKKGHNGHRATQPEGGDRQKARRLK
jgi:DNA-binding XRE family transcriptional regulator